MNTQLNDKIHAAFEPIKEAVETKGEYAGAVLAVTYGTTRNESQVWFEEAGNVCAWRALSYTAYEESVKGPGEIDAFKPYRIMWMANEIFAAVLLLNPRHTSIDPDTILRDEIGNSFACEWLTEQHRMHVETVVKTSMAMTMNQMMQQQAQAALMAEQLSKGKLLGGPFGKGNGGIGRG